MVCKTSRERKILQSEEERRVTKRKDLVGVKLPPPTAGRVREVFVYNSVTGVLRWRIRLKRSKAKAGDVAGCPGGGYLQVRLDGRLCYVHQIAWLYMTGEWSDELDHRDLNGSNNEFGNLRPATRTQNNANNPLRTNNLVRLKGVSQFRGMYRARIQHNKKQMWLGQFETPEEAHAAYLSKAASLFGEFARAA